MLNYSEIFALLFLFNAQLSYGYIVKNSTDSFGEDRLIFAQVIFRHGAKNIEGTHPNDPYKDVTYWPGGFNALSNGGKQGSYDLGKYLRRRYLHLMGDRYSHKKVYIRSSDSDRCLMSAQCLAAGLFPPSESEIWNKNFDWQPIPIHTIALEKDYLLNSRIKCPRSDEIHERTSNSPKMKALMEEHSSLIKFVDHHSGLRIENLTDILHVYYVLKIEQQNGFVLPDWAIETLKSDRALDYLSAYSYKFFTDSTESKKTRAGFLIREIFDRFKDKTLGVLEPDRTLWLYSSHGTIIVSVLNSLDIFDLTMPTFSSSIHFELYQRGKEYYIQIFYRKLDTDIVSPLNIPNCGTKCPLEKLYKLYDQILPKDSEDFQSLCRLD